MGEGWVGVCPDASTGTLDALDSNPETLKPSNDTQAALDETLERLHDAQGKLWDITQKIDTLQANYSLSKQKQSDLEAQVDDCQRKIQRATKLVAGLGIYPSPSPLPYP